MAALQTKEDTATQTVLQSPLLPSLGNIFSTLVWLAILAFFFLPAFGEGQVNWENVGLIVVFFLVTVGATALNTLVTTRVVVDQTNRQLAITRQVLGFPLRSTVVPFANIANVEYQYYRQSSGRYSHDAWRVNVVTKDGMRLPLNWDGKQDEMAGLAQKLVQRTGAEMTDQSTKPTSTVKQILDNMKGQPAEDAPAEPDAMPSAPDAHAPPPVANVPWSMPSTSNQAPSPELAPVAPGPVESPQAPVEDAMPDSTGMADTSTSARPSDLSIGELEKRIASDPMDAEGRYVLASKYQGVGQIDRAIALYRETLRIDTTNAEAQNDLGVALQKRGKRGEAEAAFRRALALDPFSSTAHLNLGLVLRSMNRAADASQEFYQARQNARTAAQTRAAEAASTGAKMDLQLATR